MKAITFLNVLEAVRDTNVSLLVTFIFLLVLVILSVVLIIVIHFYKKNADLNHLKHFKSDRIFVVNVYKQIVDFFDFNDLKKIKTVSFMDFLNFFDSSDQNEIKRYITSLLNLDFNPYNEDAIYTCNLNLSVSKKRVSYRAILSCREVDKEKQVVYLQVTRLMNTPIEHHNNKRNAKHDVYDPSIIVKMYDEGKFNKGTFHIIRLYNKANTISYINEYALRRYLIDAVYSITNNNNSCFFKSGSVLEFSLLDFRILNDYQASNFVFDIMEKIEQYLDLHGLNDLYDFNICSSQVKDLPLYFDDAYRQLTSLFKTARDINRKVSIFKSEMSESSIIESTYNVELNRIIKNKDFDTSFCPVVHVTNSRVTINSYLSNIKFHSNLIDNYNDVFKYAHEFRLSNDIMSLLLRKIVPPFISQNSNPGATRLVLNVSIHDVVNVVKIIEHIAKANTIKLVLLIPSFELIDIENDEFVIKQLASLREKGYEIALLIKQGDYVLKEATYKLFDYFYVDLLLEQNVKQDSRSFIKAHGLLEKLNKVSIPIVAINLLSFQAIELLSKAGIKDFSSNVISKENSMLLPLDVKTIKRLLTMVK